MFAPLMIPTTRQGMDNSSTVYKKGISVHNSLCRDLMGVWESSELCESTK